MTERLATEMDLRTFPGDHQGKLTLLQLQVDSCRIAQDHGFWDTFDDINSSNAACQEMGDPWDEKYSLLVIESKLMLAVGELSEAEDALRHHKPIPEFAEELADAVIRIADLAHKMGINLEAAIIAKQAYNEGRPMLHGKRF